MIILSIHNKQNEVPLRPTIAFALDALYRATEASSSPEAGIRFDWHLRAGTAHSSLLCDEQRSTVSLFAALPGSQAHAETSLLTQT